MSDLAARDTLLPPDMGKAEAVLNLADRAGLSNPDAWGDSVPHTIESIERILGRPTNKDLAFCKAGALNDVTIIPVYSRSDREMTPPVHTNGPPSCFHRGSHFAHSPNFNVLRVRNGYLCQLADGPLVVAAQGDVGISDYSSRYARLVHFYNHNLRASLADARFIEGTAVVMCDDVRPLNYCHWMIDWLPRLAFLGDRARRRDVYVITMPVTTEFQRETLRMCGFDEDRIIELKPFETVRARELLVPSDLHDTPHPAHKGAAWVYSYLRGTIGWRSLLAGAATGSPGQKLYVSRADANGRRVFNEDELFAVLSRAGYRRITLSGMTVSEQVAAFAGASHIIAPHGAGLANFAFAAPGAQLVEIFPRTYGTAAFYVLAAAQENPYASYVAEVVSPGKHSQSDHITLDVADFAERCAAFL